MTVREVFLTHGKAYLQEFVQRMLSSHKKVIQAINQISREAHVSGLTDRIAKFLSQENN